MDQSFREMTKDDLPAPGDGWVAVTQGVSGYFAVHMWINDEEGCPFPEPYDTGFGRYPTPEQAFEEVKLMAEDLNLPYQPLKKDPA